MMDDFLTWAVDSISDTWDNITQFVDSIDLGAFSTATAVDSSGVATSLVESTPGVSQLATDSGDAMGILGKFSDSADGVDVETSPIDMLMKLDPAKRVSAANSLWSSFSEETRGKIFVAGLQMFGGGMAGLSAAKQREKDRQALLERENRSSENRKAEYDHKIAADRRRAQSTEIPGSVPFAPGGNGQPSPLRRPDGQLVFATPQPPVGGLVNSYMRS